MHAVEVADGAEWEALHKALERSGAIYHRVPAPDGKAVILTDAEIGDVVQNPEGFVPTLIANQPCDSKEKRRMTSSREVKGAGDRSSGGRWRRVGTSHLRLGERVRVYTEEGCEPTEVPKASISPDVVVAHDVRLPSPDTPEMDRLAQRLELTRDDPPPPGMSPWQVAIR